MARGGPVAIGAIEGVLFSLVWRHERKMENTFVDDAFL